MMLTHVLSGQTVWLPAVVRPTVSQNQAEPNVWPTYQPRLPEKIAFSIVHPPATQWTPDGAFVPEGDVTVVPRDRTIVRGKVVRTAIAKPLLE